MNRRSRWRLALVALVAGPEAALLTARVRKAFDAQRRTQDRLRSFVADAGHELRTPPGQGTTVQATFPGTSSA
ncbi:MULTISPECIES: cell wall metabolism sensor histidine kinase WalK [Saccharothrix]|uniref:cell wall metabolism sensor histidine kinase WalK n=1 Tax=Saccharothrix TaxID=2071 RepID=UPI000964C2AB|nr:cell wall metabolism sensor histidine kinase WalK [Saccharothrix sp. CB00851]OKI25715.1 hypothetical protein A6A25_32485 [Saccharothrix sp. CB00851]